MVKNQKSSVEGSLRKFFKNHKAEKQIEELINQGIVWNEAFIQKRTERMAEVIWANLTPFLDLSTPPVTSSGKKTGEKSVEEGGKEGADGSRSVPGVKNEDSLDKFKNELMSILGEPVMMSAERTEWNIGDRKGVMGVRDGIAYVELPGSGLGLRCHKRDEHRDGQNIWHLVDMDRKKAKEIIRFAKKNLESLNKD